MQPAHSLSCRVFTGGEKAMMSDMYVHGNDIEGKPLQEDVITREAASKSVHVLGQGNTSSLMLQHTANLPVIVPCDLQLKSCSCNTAHDQTA